MKVTTKIGDKGMTKNIYGEDIEKTDLRIGIIGQLDELDAHLAICQHVLSGYNAIVIMRDDSFIQNIRKVLYKIMTTISEMSYTFDGKCVDYSKFVDMIDVEIEQKSFQFEKNFPEESKNFVYSGSTKTSAQINLARAVARRVEREMCYLKKYFDLDSNILIFMNRLSDYLYVLSLCYEQEINYKGDNDE